MRNISPLRGISKGSVDSDTVSKGTGMSDKTEEQFFHRGEELYDIVNDFANNLDPLLGRLDRSPSMESTNSLASFDGKLILGPIEPLLLEPPRAKCDVRKPDPEKVKAFADAQRPKKCTRTYAVWSQEERELVLEALVERSRQLIAETSTEELHKYLLEDKKGGSKRKRQTDLDIIAAKLPHKTSSQVRDYYYRTLKQIDKLLKQVDYVHDLTNPEGARVALLFYHHHLGRAHIDFGLHCRQKGDRKAAADFMSTALKQSLEEHKKNVLNGNVEEFLKFIHSNGKASDTSPLVVHRPVSKSGGTPRIRKVPAKPLSQRKPQPKRQVTKLEVDRPIEILPPYSPLKRQKKLNETMDVLGSSSVGGQDDILMDTPQLDYLFENKMWPDSFNIWFDKDDSTNDKHAVGFKI